MDYRILGLDYQVHIHFEMKGTFVRSTIVHFSTSRSKGNVVNVRTCDHNIEIKHPANFVFVERPQCVE